MVYTYLFLVCSGLDSEVWEKREQLTTAGNSGSHVVTHRLPGPAFVINPSSPLTEAGEPELKIT